MKTLLLLLALALLPASAQAVDPKTIFTVIAELKALFGDEAPEPDIDPNDDPCHLHLSFLNLRGPYGNYEYDAPSILFNQYWMGSLFIKAAEGFTQNDRLEISGNVQHRDEFCHPKNTRGPGPALQYQFNIDLNNTSIVSMIDANGKLVQDSALDDGDHSGHRDELTRARATANTFVNRGNLEIGQVQLSIEARHVPDPGLGLASAAGLFLALLAVSARRRHR